MNKKVIYIYLFTMFAVTLLWDGILFLQPDKKTIWNYLFNLVYILPLFFGAICGLYMTFKTGLEETLGRAWFFFSIGFFSYIVASVIWVVDNVLLQIPIPYPSFADMFFLLFIPCIGFGTLSFIHTMYQKINFDYLFEAALFTILSGICIFFFLEKPDLSSDLSFITKLTDIAYPLGDTILVSLAFYSLRVASTAMKKGIILLCIGLIFQVIGDFLFSYQTGNNSYWNGNTADLTFAISAFFLGLAMVNFYFLVFRKNDTPTPTPTT